MIIGSLLCIHQITICTVPISYLRDTFCHVSCGNLCDIDNWNCLRTGEIQPIRKFGISSRVFLLECSDQCWRPCQRVDDTLQLFFFWYFHELERNRRTMFNRIILSRSKFWNQSNRIHLRSTDDLHWLLDTHAILSSMSTAGFEAFDL